MVSVIFRYKHTNKKHTDMLLLYYKDDNYYIANNFFSEMFQVNRTESLEMVHLTIWPRQRTTNQMILHHWKKINPLPCQTDAASNPALQRT